MLQLSKNTIKGKFDSSELYSMSMLHSHRFGRLVAYSLLGIFSISFIIMFLPWQQNIFSVQGDVIALYPEDRPQKIESTIAGKIEKWHVHEGQHIKKGEPILTLTEVKEK